MVWNFQNFIYRLESMGLVDVVLPFLIIFTVVFAALQKSKILGHDSKKYNVMIAFVMALSTVIPHVTGMYPPGGDVVNIMNKALPSVSLIVVAVIMVMLVLGVIGGELNFAGTSLGTLSIWASIIGVAIIFLASADVFTYTPRWLYWIRDPYIIETVIIILVFGVIIGFITKDDSNAKNRTMARGFKDLSSTLFGGGKQD